MTSVEMMRRVDLQGGSKAAGFSPAVFTTTRPPLFINSLVYLVCYPLVNPFLARLQDRPLYRPRVIFIPLALAHAPHAKNIEYCGGGGGGGEGGENRGAAAIIYSPALMKSNVAINLTMSLTGVDLNTDTRRSSKFFRVPFASVHAHN